MSDVVLLEVIKSIFLGCMAAVVIWAFGKQIRNALGSVGTFKVGGASFTLGDGRETAESYALLAEVMVRQLSNLNHMHALTHTLSAQDIEQLGRFAAKYSSTIPKEKWNEEMLRNIGYLLQYAGRCQQAVSIFDSLLKNRPDHYDFLDNKGFALLRHGGASQLANAEEIYLKLIERDPSSHRNHLRLACVRSGLKKAELAVQSLKTAIELGTLEFFPDALNDRMLHFARATHPEAFAELAISARIVRERQPVMVPNAQHHPGPGDATVQGS